MDKDTTYRKTTSGSEAIAARHPGLSQRHRSLLILVDGRRDTRELAALASGFGDVEELLQPLLNQGFIEPVERKSAAAPATPAGAKPPTHYLQARNVAVRRLTDLLGPSAETLCIKLEAARSAEEFRAALKRVEAILREALGRSAPRSSCPTWTASARPERPAAGISSPASARWRSRCPGSARST
ncbi:hypothetical protein [Ramlibacter montanisoli]|uniref:Uncharacterized protein n=1 Tax=Ramlibacter montanisoli TaxID=2732512 RepID=A0A849KCH6_9BURK|nr:hypothetical protein [Ramlibacter montanisoli]NNU42695.1 hypothetical protein [Ramlibacter montanisoli]